nr:hypothetical protein CIT39_07605 [Bradyrhizobium symbiodeficiens]
MLPWAGESGGLFARKRGCSVSSVASREMAAGLQALSAMNVVAREPASGLAMDPSQCATRSLEDGFENSRRRCAAMLAEVAVPQQKRAGIRFGGAVASWYPQNSMGAEEIVPITSRRPN